MAFYLIFYIFFLFLLFLRIFAPDWLHRKKCCVDDFSSDSNSLEQEFPILSAIRQSIKMGFKYTFFNAYLRLHSIFQRFFYYLVWALILFLLIDVIRNNAVVMNGLGERWNGPNFESLWFEHYTVLRMLFNIDVIFFSFPLSIYYIAKKKYVAFCRVVFNNLFLFFFLTFSFAISSLLGDLLFISMFLYAGIFSIPGEEVLRGFFSAIR